MSMNDIAPTSSSSDEVASIFDMSRSPTSSIGDPPDVAPLPVAPPPPPTNTNNSCADFQHCNANGTGACDMNTTYSCPGTDPYGFNFTYYNALHPPPLGFAVQVCSQCVLHDQQTLLLQVRQWANAQAQSGNLVQLCHGCVRDEMRLYWQRINLNIPKAALPTTAAPSLQQVAQWPNLSAPDQNLCVCRSNAITAFANYCHACRDRAFLDNFTNPWHNAEQYLRTKTKAAITGRVQSALNSPHHNVAPRTITNREFSNAQIGRMCPCGEHPKAPEAPNGEFIAFCLACSGVRVIAQHIPARYQQANMVLPPAAGLRRSPRNHAGSRECTKGPARAQRSLLHRVNIERGWIRPADPLIGNT